MPTNDNAHNSLTIWHFRAANGVCCSILHISVNEYDIL